MHYESIICSNSVTRLAKVCTSNFLNYQKLLGLTDGTKVVGKDAYSSIGFYDL